jgi:hypothetical protein
LISPIIVQDYTGEMSQLEKQSGAIADSRTTSIVGRLIRFRLRTLLVLMTVVAVWLGLTMKRLREQERAVARIRELGGQVTYDYQIDAEGNPISNPEPPGLQSIRRLFGPQWGLRVIHVDLTVEVGSRATDRDLEVLLSLPDITYLNVGETRLITNEGLRIIGGLAQLKELDLSYCEGITDDGLVHLSRLHQLWLLSLVGCRMNGSGLRHIQHLPLRSLSLNWVPVTDDHLAAVAAMTQLSSLDMQETAITGHGLTHVALLKNLRHLDVNRTGVDDASLMYLFGLSKLTHLYLSDTKVTGDAVAKLRQALPNLQQVDY